MRLISAEEVERGVDDALSYDPENGLLKRLVRRVRRYFCRHQFRLCDLKQTGIPIPDPPHEKERYDVHMAYFQSLPKHPSHTMRVRWPCRKCGKVFHAHCGLDISPEHGPIIPSPNALAQPAPSWRRLVLRIARGEVRCKEAPKAKKRPKE